MTRPTIAISRTEIAWGEFGFDTSDKIALVLNIQALSKGRLKTLVAKELRFLLFNDNANEKVTHAMMNALAWVADIERRGLNAINERNVLGFFAEISDTFVESLEKYLERNLPR